MDYLQLLERRIQGYTTYEWLLALGVAVGVVLLLATVKRLFLARARRLAERTDNRVDDFVVELVERSGLFFYFFVAALVLVRMLGMGVSEGSPLRLLLVIALVIQLGLWGNAFIGAFASRYARERATDTTSVSTITAVAFLARLGLWAVLLLVALDNVGIDVTALVAGLGITGVAVALAVQNVFGDFLAAASIVVDKPFVVGDFIIVDQMRGTVEYIGLKTTRIRSLDGEQIAVANTDLLKHRIRNMRLLQERRVAFLLSVTYDTPADVLERIPAMLREIVEAQADTRFDRAHFKRFADAWLELEVVYFVLTPDYLRYMDIQQAINLAILRRFRAEGIEFAFPTQTVHVVRGDQGTEGTRG